LTAKGEKITNDVMDKRNNVIVLINIVKNWIIK